MSLCLAACGSDVTDTTGSTGAGGQGTTSAPAGGAGGESTTSEPAGGGGTTATTNTNMGAGGSGGSGAGASTGAGDGGEGGAGPGGAGGGGNPAPYTPVPAKNVCHITCVTAADCVLTTADDGPYNEDNWTCDGGECVWEGCKDSAECAAVDQEATLCAPVPGSSISACYRGCATPSDCTDSRAQLLDASHFTCTDGLCAHLGCQSDEDCTESSNLLTICDPTVPGGLLGCVAACATAADCSFVDFPLTGPDNFACENQRCVYLGCMSDIECVEVYKKPGMTCE